MTKHAIVIGATSGIGRALAFQLAVQGWRVGIAGRRTERLEAMCSQVPDAFVAQRLDVCQPEAEEAFLRLAEALGGASIVFLVAGIGFQNPALDAHLELTTARTNAEGFMRMAGAAFRYFKARGGGRIVAVTSIAGTKGLGVAPAYSATKRLQNTYLEALAQLAHMQRLPIGITDVRPGFVDTDLLAGGTHYPMLMQPERVAARIIRVALRGRRVLTVDWRYALLTWAWRRLPRWLWERLNVHTRA